MDGGFTFTCAYCEYCMTTLNLDGLRGNLRTQAATIMNRHAALSHVGKLTPITFRQIDRYAANWCAARPVQVQLISR
jgi:hypothetical protein